MKKQLLRLSVLVTVAVLAAAVFTAGRRARKAENRLETLCRAALWETAEDVQTLALSLEKAALSADGGQEAALLSRISRSASDVHRALAFLPMEEEALRPALAYTARLSEQAADLLPQAAEEGLTADHRAVLQRHLAVCRQLAAQLRFLQEDAAHTARLLSAPLLLEGVADAPAPRQPLGLPPGEVTQAEAMAAARAFVGEERVTSISPAPDAGGAIPAWGVTVRTADLQLNLEITRQGGRVLWMMPETAAFSPAESIAACRQAAEALLAAQGFGEVEAADRQVYDGLCVLSFVPVAEGVLLYPDLIRVQVRMDTAEVVGLEARSYWMNHRPRSLPAPALSAEEAVQRIAPELEADGARLCLLPFGEEERLCWEVAATRGGDRYLVYVDAATGREAAIRKIVPLEQGYAVT